MQSTFYFLITSIILIIALLFVGGLMKNKKTKTLWSNQTANIYANKNQTGPPSVLRFIYPKMHKENLFFKNMSLLSIGGGTGILETKIAKEFNALIGYIDPSKPMYKKFEETIKNNMADNQIIEKYYGTFQTYKSNHKYDLIIAVHSWHYIGCNENFLKKALSYLSSKGKLCIVLTSSNSFSKPLKDILHPKGHSFLNHEELSAWAEKQHLTHRSVPVDKLVPLDKFIKNNEFTNYGRYWMELIGRKEWSNISEHTKKQAKEILISYSVNNVLNDRWGMLIFNKSDFVHKKDIGGHPERDDL